MTTVDPTHLLLLVINKLKMADGKEEEFLLLFSFLIRRFSEISLQLLWM